MDIVERFFKILGFDYDNGKRCECGEHKECVSKITISGPGVLSRKNMYQCGRQLNGNQEGDSVLDSFSLQREGSRWKEDV